MRKKKGRRFKGVSAGKGEVPKDGKHKRDKIRDPVIFYKELQQRKGCDLDYAGGGGEKGEFYCLPQLFFVISHLTTTPYACF